MKEKILAAIKAKFPGVTLSKKRLEQIAKTIEEDVIDDETKIDAALTTYNKYNSLTDMAKTDADLRGLNKKVGELEKGTKGESGSTESGKPAKTEVDADEEPGSQSPAWAKSLIETNKTLLQKVSSLEGEKVMNTTREKLNNDLKDVPGIVWSKRQMPTNDEEYTAFVDDVKKDWADAEKTNVTAGLKNLSKPAGSGHQTKTTDAETKVDPILQKYVDTNKGRTSVGAPGFVISGGMAKLAAPAATK